MKITRADTRMYITASMQTAPRASFEFRITVMMIVMLFEYRRALKIRSTRRVRNKRNTRNIRSFTCR